MQMFTFTNIKELLNTLSREQALLSEMFEKRKTFSYKYDSLEMVEVDDDRIRYLVGNGVIRENGNWKLAASIQGWCHKKGLGQEIFQILLSIPPVAHGL